MAEAIRQERLFRTQELRPLYEAPYRNLILAGEMGIGKTEVAERIAAHFNAPLRDIEAELEASAGMPAQDVRELYGEARLTNMETELCRELSLQRGAVVVVHASIMLNDANRRRLEDTGVVLVLTTALNEILRRLYQAKGERFEDIRERARTMIRLKREWKARDLPGYPRLDTTTLSVEEVAKQAIGFWQSTSEA
jgi:shikimate kinase